MFPPPFAVGKISGGSDFSPSRPCCMKATECRTLKFVSSLREAGANPLGFRWNKKPPFSGGSETDQLESHLRKRNLVASRFIAAIDVVSGIPFGQDCTQFCEFPHSCNPPSPRRASSRSSLFMAPVG